MNAYETLLQTLGETDSSIFDELLFDSDNPKSFLNPSKIRPSIGTRKIILRNKQNSENNLSLVNLAQKRLIFHQNYKLPETDDDLNHDFIEEIPVQWELSHQYISSRLNNQPFQGKLYNNRGIFDFIDSIHELSTFGFEANLLSQFYFTCKKLFTKETKKKKDISDLINLFPKIEKKSQMKIESTEIIEKLKNHEIKKRNQHLVNVFTNYNSFLIANVDKLESKESDRNWFQFEKFKVETKMDLLNYFQYYLRKINANSISWLFNASRHVWIHKIPNDDVRKNLIKKFGKSKKNKNQIYFEILRYCLSSDDYECFKQHIQSIWICENFNVEIEQILFFLKNENTHPWKLINHEMVKRWMVSVFSGSSQINTKLFISNLFLPHNLKFKQIKRKKRRNLMNLELLLDPLFPIQRNLEKELKEFQIKNEIQEMAHPQIACFMVQKYFMLAIKAFPILLKFFIFPLDELLKLQKIIYHQKMTEFLFHLNNENLYSPIKIFNEFEKFMELKHPKERIILFMAQKKEWIQLQRLNLPHQIFLNRILLSRIHRWFKIFKIFQKSQDNSFSMSKFLRFLDLTKK
jgi:hypothetical protein